MIEIVTLAEVKRHIRLTEDEYDNGLDVMIQAATETALATADAWDPTSPPPARLKLAVLAHIAQAFDDRVNGDAPEGNARLLGPLRMLDV